MNRIYKKIRLSAALTLLTFMPCNTYTMTQQDANELLFEACYTIDLAKAQRAIAQGANINYAPDGESCLMIATISNYPDDTPPVPPSPAFVRFLIEQGADVHIVHSYSRLTVLDYAISRSQSNPRFAHEYNEIIQLLRNASDIREESDRPELIRQNAFPSSSLEEIPPHTPRGNQQELNRRLWQACHDKNFEMAVTAINQGADVNSRHFGTTPLIEAAIEEPESILFDHNPVDLRLINLLIANNADVHAYNNAGWTALGLCNSEQVRNLLIQAGAREEMVYGILMRQNAFRIPGADAASPTTTFPPTPNRQNDGNFPDLMSPVQPPLMNYSAPRDNQLEVRLAAHQAWLARDEDPAAIAAGFVSYTAHVQFNAAVGNNINPNNVCCICTDKLGYDGTGQIDDGRIVQCTCKHVYHASCFNQIISYLNPVTQRDSAGRTMLEADPEHPGLWRPVQFVPCPLCRQALVPMLSTIVPMANE